MFFTLPLGYGLFSLVAGILLLVAEFLAAVQALDKYSGLSKDAEPELPNIPESWYPDVDILIATHNEPRELLFKTVNACTFLRYPDKSKIHIYICDDTNRPEMASLAAELEVGYFGISDNKFLKAGNMNNALTKTRSPLVLTLDADMIPVREILMKTVPYFFLPRLKKLEHNTWVPREQNEIDPSYKIGFIQTPQSFYNADLFQFNLYSENRIPNEQDYFFREVNVNRNTAGAPIYAGTNTLLSREALEEAGYIATGTITEDFATGLNIQRKGWSTFATSEPLAHGLAPDSINGLLNQRERWGRGCVQTISKVKLFTVKGLSWKTRLSYANCYAYWWTFAARLIFIIAPILFSVFRMRIVICTWWQFFICWLPYYFFYGLTLKLTSGKTRNQHWNSVIDTIIFPYMAGPVLFESLGITLKKFIVTSKTKTVEPKSTWLYALPHLLLLVTSLAALVVTVASSLKTSAVYNLIIMFWLVVNSKNLILAIFFMWGRVNVRRTSRFYVDLPMEIRAGGSVISGRTLDISENGLAFKLNRPEFIDPNSEFDLEVTAPPYRAVMRARILHIEQLAKDEWKYCVLITQMDAENTRQYFQIIYDRHHSMPDRITDDWSMFDDYSLNLSKRAEMVIPVHRRLPRIETAVPVSFDSGLTGEIINFNYQYISLKISVGGSGIKPFPLDEVMEYLDSADLFIGSQPDLCFKLVYVSVQPERESTLYYISNWAALFNNPGYLDLVDQLARKQPVEAFVRNEVYASGLRVMNLEAAELMPGSSG